MARGVTLITGASAGLGAEFARQCRGRGETLVLVARRKDRLEALRQALGEGVFVHVADLVRPDQVEALFRWLEAEGLEIDTLINNAGFGATGAFAATARERLLEMIDLNVRSLTDLCRLVLPAMIERRRGAILNVASTAAFQAGPYAAVYYATKAYVLSLTEALHHEAKGSGVRVSALCPGPTATEFFEVAGAPDSKLARVAVRPEGVVAAGLRGLDRNAPIVIPGIANKVGAFGTRLMPRSALRRIVASLKS
ncbi:MAG TPA: SDR family oxidoreductase [Allosphingosinicella sp.]|nr:SDR family oxidoreductase [Allosphingosinicella sp.]